MTPRGLPRQQAAEHEFEAELGLPEPLPKGERLLWQGSPDWRVLAREALHTRQLIIYFAVLLSWRAANVWINGGSLIDAGVAVLWLLPVAIAAIAVLLVLAVLMARTSVYTITDKRVVMRIGIVLNITFNLPHSQIVSASLRADAAGTGNITLLLNDADRIAYVHLWPHARPWHLKRTEPMLRALPRVHAVAAILSAALADAAGMTRPTLQVVQTPPRNATTQTGKHSLAA